MIFMWTPRASHPRFQATTPFPSLFGLVCWTMELGFVDLGIFNRRYLVLLPSGKWRRRFGQFSLMEAQDDVSVEYTMFGELKNVALEVLNWEASSEELSIKYILHNGSFFFMINIDGENDINGVFKASRTNSNGILLVVTLRNYDKDGLQHLCENRFEHKEITRLTRETTAKTEYKVKEVTVASPIKEFSTIDLKEDNDVNSHLQ